MGCTISNRTWHVPEHHHSICLCGTKACGKSTFWKNSLWNTDGGPCEDGDGFVIDPHHDDHEIASKVLLYILCGIVQLCKVIMSRYDPVFTKFQSTIRRTTDLNSKPLTQAYKEVVEFYYNNVLYVFDDVFDVWVPITDMNPQLDDVEIIYRARGDINQITIRFLDYLSNLWESTEMQHAYNQYGNEYQCIDNLPYFMNKLYDMFDGKNSTSRYGFIDLFFCVFRREDFLRTYDAHHDVHYSLIKSPFVGQDAFDARKRTTLFYDMVGSVGTGSNDRRDRWIYGFRNCLAVLFVASLDDYCKEPLCVCMCIENLTLSSFEFN